MVTNVSDRNSIIGVERKKEKKINNQETSDENCESEKIKK